MYIMILMSAREIEEEGCSIVRDTTDCSLE